MDRPSLAEHRRELLHLVEGRLGPWMLVLGHRTRFAFPSRDRHGNDLSPESSLTDRGSGPALALQRVGVLLLAWNPVEIRELLGGLPHQEPADRIEEAVSIHAVGQGRVPEAVARAGAVEQVGDAGHALRP